MLSKAKLISHNPIDRSASSVVRSSDIVPNQRTSSSTRGGDALHLREHSFVAQNPSSDGRSALGYQVDSCVGQKASSIQTGVPAGARIEERIEGREQQSIVTTFSHAATQKKTSLHMNMQLASLSVGDGEDQKKDARSRVINGKSDETGGAESIQQEVVVYRSPLPASRSESSLNDAALKNNSATVEISKADDVDAPKISDTTVYVIKAFYSTLMTALVWFTYSQSVEVDAEFREYLATRAHFRSAELETNTIDPLTYFVSVFTLLLTAGVLVLFLLGRGDTRLE